MCRDRYPRRAERKCDGLVEIGYQLCACNYYNNDTNTVTPASQRVCCRKH